MKHFPSTEKSKWMIALATQLCALKRYIKAEPVDDISDLAIAYRKIYNTRHTFITAMLKCGQLSVLEIAQIVGHTNTKMILENHARFIKGEHLKISRFFDLFKSRGDMDGDIRGDTEKCN